MNTNTEYKNGQNSALIFITTGKVKGYYPYGTRKYNDWYVGFCDELKLANVKMPVELVN